MKSRQTLVLLTLACPVVIADQLTKALAEQRGLVATNPAYAFGVVDGAAPVLIAGALIVLAAFLALIVRPAMSLGVPPLFSALIIGGLVSNTFDRVRFGAARDFLTTPWAIVNVADIAVAVGIIAFVVTAAWRLNAERAHTRTARAV